MHITGAKSPHTVFVIIKPEDAMVVVFLKLSWMEHISEDHAHRECRFTV